jgi:UDP:flavonoid glycosyltransferase YjiC (YdhE family)
MNAAACVRSGAGLALAPDEVTTSSVGEAVSRLLAERSFRDRARGLANEIAGMPGPADIAATLEGLLPPG